jgi:hypothetical protein
MGIGNGTAGMLHLRNDLRVLFMTFQDLLTITVFFAIALWFSDGGPGTPKRIRIPGFARNWQG